MKAFLLAAGYGTRLRPLTDTIPKCMVPIVGRPLLDIWLDSLARAGVDDVLVNLHYLADVVSAHVAARPGPPRIHTVHEPNLLGSAGTLMANRDWVDGEESFLVCYADNLTDFDLRPLISAHLQTPAAATVAVFHADDPSQCGIVETDDNGWMVGFTEKPVAPLSDLSNAGMYAFDNDVLDELQGPPPLDIGYDLLPKLLGRAQTIAVEGYFRDIGTIQAYDRAQIEWPSRRR